MPYVIPARTVVRRKRPRRIATASQKSANAKNTAALKRRFRRPVVSKVKNPNRVGQRAPQGRYVPVNNKRIVKPVEKEKNAWPWPKEITAAFAISIRPERFRSLQTRMGPWGKHVRLFAGTDGRRIDRKKWSSKIRGNFKRGEIGCYDAHVRLWNRIAKMSGPVLVMEDDASMFYNQETSQRLRHIFDELKRTKQKWDILYLGHYGDRMVGAEVAPGIRVASMWQGLFAYLITPRAAKILANGAWPMRHPSDMYVGTKIKPGQIRALRAEPRFCFVVTRNSDTSGIA